jgi:hypothetical protein
MKNAIKIKKNIKYAMKNKNKNYAMKNMERKYFYEFLCKS